VYGGFDGDQLAFTRFSQATTLHPQVTSNGTRTAAARQT
jgi:hypothetical protein